MRVMVGSRSQTRLVTERSGVLSWTGCVWSGPRYMKRAVGAVQTAASTERLSPDPAR